MSDRYTFNKQTNLKEYEEILKNSPQGNIFCSTRFLDIIKIDYHLWNVKQGEEVKAVMCFTVSKDKKNIIVNDLVIYTGIIFNLDEKRLETKKRHDEFKITEFIIKNITKKYKKIEFQLSPFFKDIRPFQWYNYNKKKEKKFDIEVKFTSYINYSNQNLDIFENTKLYNSMETVRRYDYRTALKEDASIKESDNVEKFISFYIELMKKQKIKLSLKKIKDLSNILSQIIKSKIGNLFYICNKKNSILYSIVYLRDDKRGYYFLGAGGQKNKTSWQSTFGHCGIVKFMKKKYEISSVDLEGVNSPNRGWFKLSLGGDLSQYFKVKL